MIRYLNKTQYAAHLRVNEELTILEKERKKNTEWVFVIKRGETKENFYIKRKKKCGT
jgi:hypothetical protein